MVEFLVQKKNSFVLGFFILNFHSTEKSFEVPFYKLYKQQQPLDKILYLDAIHRPLAGFYCIN